MIMVWPLKPIPNWALLLSMFTKLKSRLQLILHIFHFSSDQPETESHSKPHKDNQIKKVFPFSFSQSSLLQPQISASAHSAHAVKPIRMQKLTGTFLGNHFFYPIQDERIVNQNMPPVESFWLFRFH